MNKALFVGRLTKDPEKRGKGDGEFAVFTIAVNRPFLNKNNEREADFIQIKAFRNIGKNCLDWLKKGSLVAVEASVRTGSYERDGQRIYTIDFVADRVQFLHDLKQQNQQKSQQKNYFDENDPFGFDENDPFKNDGYPVDISDDDLPF